MQYNRLGKAGIKVSELSYGSWLTFSNDLDREAVKKTMHRAFDQGINFFDTAETYAQGEAEILMGEALQDFRREDLVVSTKIFWGGDGPNDTGLSWKHLVEGTKNSLRRLQLDYVDLLFCHRPDPDTPIEETVRAMDHLVKSGYCFYWGTSEWSAQEIEEAFTICREINATPPTMEQPEYNMFNRERFEQEYAPLFEKYNIGSTIWSPLASGVLTGKYVDGKIPPGSRLDKQKWLQKVLTDERVQAVNSLSTVAKDLGCELSQLALAWCLKNPNVSTVILGTSSDKQLDENLIACQVKERLTGEVMKEIEKILKGPTLHSSLN